MFHSNQILMFLRQKLFMVMFMCSVVSLHAQVSGDPFDVNIEVKMLNEESGEYENRAIKYGLIETEANAKAILEKAQTLSGRDLDVYLEKNEINSIVGIKAQGRFKRKVLAGMAILAIIPIESKGVVIPIHAGKTELTGTIKYHALKTAIGTGTARPPRIVEPEPPEPDGDSITFTIKYPLEAKWAKEDTRLIIQPFMVDCLVEDTVANCPPIVYESEAYHVLQDKRKSFDFEKNDPLSNGYRNDHVIVPGKETFVYAEVKMRKPILKRTYKAPYKVSVEDYHHVYFKDSIEGSCLQLDPFKLLDFTPALGEMELTEEFQAPAESQFGETGKDLKLSYEVGEDKYIDDSLNNVQLDQIVSELNSYGKYLIRYDIEGFASPDGTYARNEDLARRRAANAVQEIGRRLMMKVQTPRISVKVCSWDDVVTELNRRGKMEVAEKVKEIIENKKTEQAIYSEVKALPEYEEIITPVLNSQRKMSCSIMFRRPHVLNAQEVVEQYFHDKNVPVQDRFRFSEGDYFNLLANLDAQKDSADIDSVTILAYNYCKNNKDFLTLRLTPYVANRMAIVMIKRGHPDKTILDPFLDYSVGITNRKRGIDEINVITINREEHILNQAVTYYMEEKLDTAKFWLGYLEKSNIEGAKALKRIIVLRKNYRKENRLSDELLAEYNEAKNYVLNSSDDNKAILYTEIPKWGKRAEGERYVNLMDDNNPKKWYLKGILWADKDKIKNMDEATENKEMDDLGVVTKQTNFKKLSESEYAQLSSVQKLNYQENLKKWEEENKKNMLLQAIPDDTVSVKGIPNYLAYFQHCFDLNPALKKFYYNEGHVAPDLRRKYKYKFDKIPAYRKLFRRLKVADDLERENLRDSGLGSANDDASESVPAEAGNQ